MKRINWGAIGALIGMVASATRYSPGLETRPPTMPRDNPLPPSSGPFEVGGRKPGYEEPAPTNPIQMAPPLTGPTEPPPPASTYFPGSTLPFDPTPAPPVPAGADQVNKDSWGNVTIVWKDGTYSWTAVNGDGSVDHVDTWTLQAAERAWATKYVYGGSPPSWAGPAW